MPSDLNFFEISPSAFAARRLGAVIRTISHPASTRSMVCRVVARISKVSVVVIDWTRIGLLPPTETSPILTIRVFRRVQ